MNFHGGLLTKKNTKQKQNCEETSGHPGLKQMLSNKMVVARRRGMVDVDVDVDVDDDDDDDGGGGDDDDDDGDGDGDDDDDDDDDDADNDYNDAHVDSDNYFGYDYTSFVLILANQKKL